MTSGIDYQSFQLFPRLSLAPEEGDIKDWLLQVNNLRVEDAVVLDNMALRISNVEEGGYSTTDVTDSSVTLTLDDDLVLCDCTSNAITVNLPAAAGATGKRYSIKKVDGSGNAATVDGSGSETIDGATTQIITIQWDCATIQCDGTSWYII